MFNVPCPHCSRTSRFDPARLPDQPVAYTCPHCQQKAVVDKRQLTAPQAGEAPAPDAPDRRFGKFPDDAVLPSGIILGEDDSVIREVQLALATLGSEVERVESAEIARQTIINEQPDLCIYVANPIAALPHAPMAPLTGLPPELRRRLYLALISDNVKTLDGNAAFLYQVNMVLSKRDLPQLGAALYSGIDFHERLYKPYFDAAELKGSI